GVGAGPGGHGADRVWLRATGIRVVEGGRAVGARTGRVPGLGRPVAGHVVPVAGPVRRRSADRGPGTRRAGGRRGPRLGEVAQVVVPEALGIGGRARVVVGDGGDVAGRVVRVARGVHCGRTGRVLALHHRLLGTAGRVRVEEALPQAVAVVAELHAG